MRQRVKRGSWGIETEVRRRIISTKLSGICLCNSIEVHLKERVCVCVCVERS